MTLAEHEAVIELYKKEKSKARLFFRLFYLQWNHQNSFWGVDYLTYKAIASDDVKLSVEDRNNIIYSLYQDDFLDVSCTMNNDNNSKICCGFLKATEKGLEAFQKDRNKNKY